MFGGDTPTPEEFAAALLKLSTDWAAAADHERAGCIEMVGKFNAGSMRELAVGLRKWAEYGLTVATALEQLGGYAETACACAAATINPPHQYTPHTPIEEH